MAYDVFSGACAGRDWSRGDEPDTYIPYLISPADTNRIVDKAVSEEQQAVEEVSRAKNEGKIDDANWRSFKKYHDEFHNWLASTGSRPYGKLKLGVAGIYKTAFEHRKRIADWRDIPKAAGIKPAGPTARGAEQNKVPPKTSAGSLWKWVAIAGAGAAAYAIIERKLSL